MARLTGNGGIYVPLSEVKNGAGEFVENMRPRSIMPINAKELMLKDADYSTPADHYFAYT